MEHKEGDIPKIITVPRASKLTDIPEYALRTLFKEHRIPGFSSGRKIYLNFSKLLAFLNDPDKYADLSKNIDAEG
ncbi:MAG: helix-turn-helix domain-containing protein [Clostridium sp.]|jgi:hypothetical protein|nr:helix-turn-helix domain-containing protein [Clostridium sp.]